MVIMAFSPSLGDTLHGWLGASSPGRNPCVLWVFSLAWLVFELASTVSQSVLNALVNDVVPPSLIGRFFGLFRAVSLAAAILFNFFLMGRAEAYATPILVGLAVVYAGGFTLMCLKVTEGVYPPIKDTGGGASPGPMGLVRLYARECFSSPFYWWVFAVVAGAGLAFAPVNSFSVFYARSLGLSMQTYGYLLVVTYLISFALTYPLGALADRIHPLRLGFATLALYGVFSFAGAFWGDSPERFAVVFVAHGVLSGSYFTATASLAARLLPRERFAQFSAAAGVLGGVLFMVVPPAVGFILDRSGSQYWLTFLKGGVLSVAGCAAIAVVYVRWRRLGGDAAYAPPEAR
jgi:maltose/moltooligosaccharide transporter